MGYRPYVFCTRSSNNDATDDASICEGGMSVFVVGSTATDSADEKDDDDGVEVSK